MSINGFWIQFFSLITQKKWTIEELPLLRKVYFYVHIELAYNSFYNINKDSNNCVYTTYFACAQTLLHVS